MRIRASTCRPHGWSRLRSPPKVQHLWAFGGICGGGMPAEAASAPHFQTLAPCFLLHPLHLFLPTIHAQLCSRRPDPSLAHRTGLSYQTQSDGVWQVLEDWGPGHSCSLPQPTLPGGDYAQWPVGAGVSGPKRGGQVQPSVGTSLLYFWTHT